MYIALHPTRNSHISHLLTIAAIAATFCLPFHGSAECSDMLCFQGHCTGLCIPTLRKFIDKLCSPWVLNLVGVFKLPKMLCAPLGSVGTLQNSALLPGCRTISVCLSFEHLETTATAGKFMELVSISVRTRTIRRTFFSNISWRSPSPS